jgi:hypothetical protein
VRGAKGAPTAVGRATTSALLAHQPAADRPLAAVNADFFSFAPAGVPTGAHVENGRLLAGPGARPVFAVDSAGRPFIGTLSARGAVSTPRGDVPLDGWNRPSATRTSLLDARWGMATDSSAPGTTWRLDPLSEGTGRPRYVVGSSGAESVAHGDTLLVHRGARASDAAGRLPVALRPGDTVTVQIGLQPVGAREAVGGFPLLVSKGQLTDSTAGWGSASFRGLNPRTALGLGAGGRRLLLAVIDGRQARVSVGMTLLETARLLQGLGAEDVLNLDGGGSSALVVRNPDAAGELRVVTHPSDATGERAVGNALVILNSCRAVPSR